MNFFNFEFVERYLASTPNPISTSLMLNTLEYQVCTLNHDLGIGSSQRPLNTVLDKLSQNNFHERVFFVISLWGNIFEFEPQFLRRNKPATFGTKFAQKSVKLLRLGSVSCKFGPAVFALQLVLHTPTHIQT